MQNQTVLVELGDTLELRYERPGTTATTTLGAGRPAILEGTRFRLKKDAEFPPEFAVFSKAPKVDVRPPEELTLSANAPILDSNRRVLDPKTNVPTRVGGRGGLTTCLSSSREATTLRPPMFGLGRVRRYLADDAPTWLYARNHPDVIGELTDITHRFSATGRLIAWTNAKVADPFDNPLPGQAYAGAGTRTFAVAIEVPWRVSATFQLTPFGRDFTRIHDGPRNTAAIVAQNVRLHSPVVPAEATRLEVRFPVLDQVRAIVNDR
jgi:hypothetical protein